MNSGGQLSEDSVVHADRRNRAIRLAVVFSVFSKSGTFLLRLISIPIAIRILGLEEFGIYASITTVVALIEALHIGIGPALTQGISRSVVQKNPDHQKRLFSTAFLTSALMTGLMVLLLLGLVAFLPVSSLFGPHFAGHENLVGRSILIAAGIIAIHVICATCDKARDGYLETNHNNAWGAAGNFAGAIVLMAGIRFFPSVEFLLIAVNGSAALAKVGNATSLFVRRSWLLPRLKNFDKSLIRPLIGDGGRFSVTYLLSALVEYNALVYLAGRLQGPEMAAVFSAMVTIHFSLTGLLQMFTIPLWPAVMDAHERGDRDWIVRSSRKLFVLSMSFAVCCGVGMIALGPIALPLWLGEAVPIGVAAFSAFALYFIFHVWRQSHQTFLLGIGKIDFCFRTILVESPLVLVAIWIALQTGSATAVYLGIAISIALVSLWVYPMMFRRAISPQEDDGIQPHHRPHRVSGSKTVKVESATDQHEKAP